MSYYNEIRSMMFAFGDNHKPNPETATFVEEIVLKQLRIIIQESFKYWNGEVLRGQDLLFLLRKNKWKMRRFVKYLQVKNLKKTATLEVKFVDEKFSGESKELLDFIKQIDETGELTDMNEFDQVKHERQLRADRIAIALDEKRYMEFHKARCVSFNSKEVSRSSRDKMRLWLNPKDDIRFTNGALDVLFHYAYETVAQIVDYALLVRMDRRRTKDPLGNLSDCHYTAAMFNGEHRFGGNNPDYSKVYTGQGQPPISVAEIREVLRRFNSPQAGVLNFGGKLPETHFLFAL